MTINVSTS